MEESEGTVWPGARLRLIHCGLVLLWHWVRIPGHGAEACVCARVCVCVCVPPGEPVGREGQGTGLLYPSGEGFLGHSVEIGGSGVEQESHLM